MFCKSLNGKFQIKTLFWILSTGDKIFVKYGKIKMEKQIMKQDRRGFLKVAGVTIAAMTVLRKNWNEGENV